MAIRDPAPEPPGAPGESLEARLRFETVLAEIAARFVNLPPDGVEDEIEHAQRQVCDLLGFERSTLWVFGDADQSTLELLRIVQPPGLPDAPARMDARVHFPWIAGRVLQGETVLLPSLDALPAGATRDRETLERFGARATCVHPVRVGGRVHAALSFASTTGPREWPPALVSRLGLVSQVFGSALSRKLAEDARMQSEATLRDLSGRLIQAQERERAWLAKELHDGLNQELAILAVELDLLGARPPAARAALRARLEDLSTRAKALSGEVHRLSHGLHPAKLERLGLVAALNGFCRELEAGAVTVRFTSSDVPRQLPEGVALCLYRVAQESLWNVVRHSGAGLATVELHASETAIRLRVMDDGKGFEPGAVDGPDSLGLVSLRERVAMVGGEIGWTSRPGSGTTVVVRVPLPPREATG